MMKYKQFLEYIYARHSGNVKLGLDRIQSILKVMGEPILNLQGIHIAGTNGKGSCAAMCEAMALEHGLTTGLNTSPHLIDYRERFRINGEYIDSDLLIRTYKKWENILEKFQASFFEITTAMAFYLFHQKKLECSIFEVGLGGRLDGTRPFKSTVTAITSISYDHTKSLGNRIRKIALEKAGILKTDTPLVLGRMSAVARNTIFNQSLDKNIDVYRLGKEYTISNIRLSDKGTVFDYSIKDLDLPYLRTNLLGEHQALNAGVAITAFLLFLNRTGVVPDKKKIRSGLLRVNWPGRLQVIKEKPLVLVDGAHNEEGIKSLVSSLDKIFPERKKVFVLAILRDKNLSNIIARICKNADKVYISKNKSNRAAEIDQQEKYVIKNNTNYEIYPDVVTATNEAVKKANRDDVIIITGSLYTISEILGNNNLR